MSVSAGALVLPASLSVFVHCAGLSLCLESKPASVVYTARLGYRGSMCQHATVSVACHMAFQIEPVSSKPHSAPMSGLQPGFLRDRIVHIDAQMSVYL